MVKTMDRRRFLKSVGISLAYGAALGTGANLGIGYLEDKLVGSLAAVEREVRELTLDVRALSGALENKIFTETEILKETYTSGKLGLLQELGIASQSDLDDIEKIIKNSEEIVEHYDVIERLRIYKDRIDNRLLSIDQKVEDSVPILNSPNDFIRRTLGKETGEKGRKQRAAVGRRIEGLCRIYDTNENNRIAEGKILERLNQYLANLKDLTPEEREMYIFLKDQYTSEGNKGHLKDFIKNYNPNNADQVAQISLRNYITEVEKLYESVVESKGYALRLQDTLKEGIKLKEEVRGKSIEEFAEDEKAINAKIYELRSVVDQTIDELKEKGYDIETREDYMAKSVVGDAVSSVITPFRVAASLIIGVYAAGTQYLQRNTKDKMLEAQEALRRETNES
jgi:hypothetical protein